jgi:glucosyl-dolichyl phosphate glucuronosyltransferase
LAQSISIIIATKNRSAELKALLDSIRELRGLHKFELEIIVGDNNSTDATWDNLFAESKQFPALIRPLKIKTPGKSSVLNEAMRAAHGDVLAFVDDDVVVDAGWLKAIENFFKTGNYQVGQGGIRIQAPDRANPEIQRLIQRYRTIPNLDFGPEINSLHSLNGANFAISREVLNRVGLFDERLGPGASGTSEDVEFARRLIRGGFRIGYMREAVVYHRIDPFRLTEEYFRTHHKRQGHSRILMQDRAIGRVFFDLGRASAQFAFYSLGRSERDRYRSKGRIYHYLGMLEAKLKNRHGSVAAILP